MCSHRLEDKTIAQMWQFIDQTRLLHACVLIALNNKRYYVASVSISLVTYSYVYHLQRRCTFKFVMNYYICPCPFENIPCILKDVQHVLDTSRDRKFAEGGKSATTNGTTIKEQLKLFVRMLSLVLGGHCKDAFTRLN